MRIFRRLLSAAARDRPVCSSLNVELRKGITHGGSAISRQAATRALEAAPSQKDNSCARTMHEAAMTMTAYGSVNSRALERLNQAYRVMAFCFFTQLLRYFALSLRKFAHSLRRKADTDPRTPPARSPGEHPRHVRSCNSRVQYLKQRIELQVEEVARLICDDESALEATLLLNALTSELVAAKLGICPELNEQADGAVIAGGANRIEQDHGALYEPEQLSPLGTFFDKAVLELPPSMRTPSNRTEIAKLVLGRSSISQIELGLLIKFIIALVAAA